MVLPPRYAKRDTLRNSIMSQRKEIRGRARNAIYGDAAAITLSEKSVYSTASASCRLSQRAIR